MVKVEVGWENRREIEGLSLRKKEGIQLLRFSGSQILVL